MKGCVIMSLEIESELYFFFEWLILNENICSEEFRLLSYEQLLVYYNKYAEWKFNSLIGGNKKDVL